jgi:hypothetical protein
MMVSWRLQYGQGLLAANAGIVAASNPARQARHAG